MSERNYSPDVGTYTYASSFPRVVKVVKEAAARDPPPMVIYRCDIYTVNIGYTFHV